MSQETLSHYKHLPVPNKLGLITRQKKICSLHRWFLHLRWCVKICTQLFISLLSHYENARGINWVSVSILYLHPQSLVWGNEGSLLSLPSVGGYYCLYGLNNLAWNFPYITVFLPFLLDYIITGKHWCKTIPTIIVFHSTGQNETSSSFGDYFIVISFAYNNICNLGLVAKFLPLYRVTHYQEVWRFVISVSWFRGKDWCQIFYLKTHSSSNEKFFLEFDSPKALNQWIKFHIILSLSPFILQISSLLCQAL